jgi:metal-responsive CopG/Arc/MetJ family transcriptional regulator
MPSTKSGGEKTSRVPITFPEGLYERLREASFKRRIAMSEIVREALREHLDRTEPQMRFPIPIERGSRVEAP